MPLVETESLVLKSYNLAEADRIVVFFTRDHGVVRGVAKGAKRLKSRFGSGLEPFSTVNLEYFQKEDRELVSIQRVDLVRSCFAAASDHAFLETFSYIADLLISFVPPHDPNERLYRMVKACIETGSDRSIDLAIIRLYFELWLLRLGGYLPDWNSCGNCKRDFTVDETGFLKSDMHVFCASCTRAQGSQQVTGLHREIFGNVQRLAPSEFAVYAADKVEHAVEVSAALKRLISNVIGKEVANEKSFAVNS
jgi:DNA repair protein RecO (recombination protein O)